VTTRIDPQEPRSLASEEARCERLAAVEQPHIAPLTGFVHELRSRDDREYPYFDPADGGVQASLLFLFEKPGPMTVERGRHRRAGSGFISRDNDDPTAENTFRFMRAAGVDRRRTAIWNTVPGWNGTRAITPAELQGGIEDLSNVLSLLPRLTTIVLVGRKAERAEQIIAGLGDYSIFKSAHPSQQVWAGYRERWEAIPGAWERAAIAAGACGGA
jgi:hypothetical protein